MSSLKELWWAARHPPADPQNLSFKDKAVLVTGANSGLGHAAAIKYATLGAKPLILAVRSQQKGEEAKAAIIRATKCPVDIFVIEILELTTFASVREFAERINQRMPQLHVVQLTAGISTPGFGKSPDGYEMALQVNVLSTTLLATLLLPKLRETAAASADGFVPCISFVNSIAHLEVKPEWIAEGETLIQRLNNESKFDQVSQYYLVKLAGIFIVRGLVERLSGDRVVVNASCPGMCKTNMGRNHPLSQRIFMAVFYLFLGRSAEQGSRTLVSATGLGRESQGKFWTNDKYLPPSQFMESERGNDLYRETWQEILGILRHHAPSGEI
ncbi:Retinol dehydrogenase 14 [Madurella fahalii]|uniref:Retinol dehydrogenase 14 n=1 Tax=Madurella fahalii TaxID=1157608 RepID=A0ABQ0G0H5_9PEZI